MLLLVNRSQPHGSALALLSPRFAPVLQPGVGPRLLVSDLASQIGHISARRHHEECRSAQRSARWGSSRGDDIEDLHLVSVSSYSGND